MANLDSWELTDQDILELYNRTETIFDSVEEELDLSETDIAAWAATLDLGMRKSA
jgi:hypothetical protein